MYLLTRKPSFTYLWICQVFDQILIIYVLCLYLLQCQAIVAGLLSAAVAVIYVQVRDSTIGKGVRLRDIYTIAACAGLTATCTAMIFGKSLDLT
jgi:hypothetical protein